MNEIKVVVKPQSSQLGEQVDFTQNTTGSTRGRSASFLDVHHTDSSNPEKPSFQTTAEKIHDSIEIPLEKEINTEPVALDHEVAILDDGYDTQTIDKFRAVALPVGQQNRPVEPQVDRFKEAFLTEKRQREVRGEPQPIAPKKLSADAKAATELNIQEKAVADNLKNQARSNPTNQIYQRLNKLAFKHRDDKDAQRFLSEVKKDPKLNESLKENNLPPFKTTNVKEFIKSLNAFIDKDKENGTEYLYKFTFTRKVNNEVIKETHEDPTAKERFLSNNILGRQCFAKDLKKDFESVTSVTIQAAMKDRVNKLNNFVEFLSNPKTHVNLLGLNKLHHEIETKENQPALQILDDISLVKEVKVEEKGNKKLPGDKLIDEIPEFSATAINNIEKSENILKNPANYSNYLEEPPLDSSTEIKKKYEFDKNLVKGSIETRDYMELGVRITSLTKDDGKVVDTFKEDLKALVKAVAKDSKSVDVKKAAEEITNALGDNAAPDYPKLNNGMEELLRTRSQELSEN